MIYESLKGKHFFIAGATGGIGSLLSRDLVKFGAKVLSPDVMQRRSIR